jgi:hypothetical protein
MGIGMWWLFGPGFIMYAMLAYACYETIRYWLLPDALAAHDIQHLSIGSLLTVHLHTLASLGFAFFIASWPASWAVSRYFEPSHVLYDRAYKEEAAAAARR